MCMLWEQHIGCRSIYMETSGSPKSGYMQLSRMGIQGEYQAMVTSGLAAAGQLLGPLFSIY